MFDNFPDSCYSNRIPAGVWYRISARRECRSLLPGSMLFRCKRTRVWPGDLGEVPRRRHCHRLYRISTLAKLLHTNLCRNLVRACGPHRRLLWHLRGGSQSLCQPVPCTRTSTVWSPWLLCHYASRSSSPLGAHLFQPHNYDLDGLYYFHSHREWVGRNGGKVTPKRERVGGIFTYILV